MPMMTTGQPEQEQGMSSNALPQERKHFTHKRLERWIRLQQFVYGLPDDYAYAVHMTEKDGQAESRALVTVGWMTWFGHGKGSDRQHSLALALLEASEALSSNGTRVFFHGLSRWIWSRLRPAQFQKERTRARAESPSEDRLAS